MRTLFILIIFSVVSSLSVYGEDQVTSGIQTIQATTQMQKHAGGHFLLKKENPRRKAKKKRVTILNRKTKKGHGHHCPSF